LIGCSRCIRSTAGLETYHADGCGRRSRCCSARICRLPGSLKALEHHSPIQFLQLLDLLLLSRMMLLRHGLLLLLLLRHRLLLLLRRLLLLLLLLVLVHRLLLGCHSVGHMGGLHLGLDHGLSLGLSLRLSLGLGSMDVRLSLSLCHGY